MALKKTGYSHSQMADNTYTEDEGLKAYVRKVFNYMMISLGITALVSYIAIRTSAVGLLLTQTATGYGYSPLGWILLLSPLALIFFASFKINTMKASSVKGILFFISAANGASISLLMLYAGVAASFQAFLITSILFGSMALYGYTTNKSLLRMGSFLIMGVWGLIIVSIISIFFGSVGIWFSYLTVVVFTGLVAYHTQMIKNMYEIHGGQGEIADKIAVISALNLYISFINIFTALLRILGENRD